METIYEIIATLALVAVDIFVGLAFVWMIEEMLAKNKLWISLLMIIIGIILLQASVYSWLPKQIGMQFALLEEAIILRDSALFSNLGALLIAQGIGIGLALLKHLWSVIRKETKFFGAAFALELLFVVIYFAAGISLFHEYPVAGETVSSGTLIGVGAIGAALLAGGIHTMNKQGTPARRNKSAR